MTPKEKAAELYKKYDAIKHSVSTHVQHKRVIKCCLIAVDEALAIINNPCFSEYDYWNDVKTELLKLK